MVYILVISGVVILIVVWWIVIFNSFIAKRTGLSNARGRVESAGRNKTWFTYFWGSSIDQCFTGFF